MAGQPGLYGGGMDGPAGQRFTWARFQRVASALVEEAHSRDREVAWLVARADGDEMVVLCSAGQAPLPGEGERFHPSTDADADVMVPLELPDGTVFGALCAVAAAPGNVGEARQANPALAQRVAEVLSIVLAAEWEAQAAQERAEAEARRAERAGEEALVDPLTGATNRRGWDRAIDAEERRRRRYGGHASVLVVDVDDLAGVNQAHGHLGGDLMLRMVADTLRDVSRDSDTIARVGDDEFALLALSCDEDHLRVVMSRLRDALGGQGVGASVGGASRRPGVGLPEAWLEAEVLMNADRARRSG